jgi:hypothetical protein
MAIKDETASGSAIGLRRDAIGLRKVLFQSITDMAPGAAIAASIPAGALYAGGALPLSVLIALVACLLTASCIGLLARELPSAGVAGHLRGPRPAPRGGVLDRVGLRAGRGADRAAGPAAAGVHHGKHDQL